MIKKASIKSGDQDLKLKHPNIGLFGPVAASFYHYSHFKGQIV
jgi:hypothetical protein